MRTYILFVALLSVFVAVSGRSLYEIWEKDLEPLTEEASGHYVVGYPELVKGHGSEQESSQHSEHSKKGESGYKNYNKQARGKVAHSDQSQLSGEHAEKGGHKKSHHDEASKQHYGYYEDNGEMGHSYKNKGGHKKGHSTKGVHNVHKLNEYKKKKEFFDEDYEEENYEKHGGHHRALGSDGGKHYKSGHSDHGFELGQHGKKEREGNIFYYLGELGRNNRHGHHGYYHDGEKFKRNGSKGHHIFWGLGHGGF